MTSTIPAVCLLTAFGIGYPSLVSAQASGEPVVLSVPDAVTRVPETSSDVPRTQSAEAVAGDPAVAARQGVAIGRVSEADEAYAQRRGGGGGGRSSGGGGRARGGSNRGGGGGGYVVRPRPVFAGGGWGGGPVFVSRPYFYDPFWASGAFGWSPMFYAPWSLMWGTAGFGGFPMFGSTTFNTGAVRLKIKPRDAQVFVNGFFAGEVDDFDGVFQSLRLAPGGHKIEVRMPGFQPLTFDVHIQPDRTLTLSEGMRAANP
jgi:hypothetical protein